MSAARPDLSVIVPCYKQARYLPDALRSALDQRGVRSEIIVVDDGSPDDAAAACKPFGSQVKLARQQNAGVSAARNRGLAEATGDFVHMLDADDAVEPDSYAALVKALRAHRSWALAAGHTVFCHADGSASDYALLAPPTGLHFQTLARACVLTPASAVIRREVFKQAGTYDTALTAAEDWDVLLRIARTGGRFGCVNRNFYRYRTHPAGSSRDPGKMFNACCEVLRRARRPDPRVKNPAAEYAQGAPADDLDERMAYAAAACLGKALGRDDERPALELLQTWKRLLKDEEPPQDHLRALFWEAGLTRAILPPTHAATARACHPAAQMLQQRCAGTELEPLAWRALEALFGTTLLEARVQELERSLVYRGARKLWRGLRPYLPGGLHP